MMPAVVSTPAPVRRARGGTLLGFVLGLLVGLAAALAVAIYVTKVPIPLVDRGVQRKPLQPDTEVERLKGWNPNAGLSNAKVPAPAADEAAGTASPPSAPADKEGNRKPEAERDPIAELIQQRTAAASPGGESNGPTVADPFLYYVQTGAYRSAEEAEAQRARLALQGLEAKISEREQGGQKLWRVRLGPFQTKAEAEAMQERLRAKQFDTALVRVQR